MITISIPVILLAGGTDEEWRLHGRAIAGHLKSIVKHDDSSERLFYDALAEMQTAQALIAEELCRGMDSAWGPL